MPIHKLNCYKFSNPLFPTDNLLHHYLFQCASICIQLVIKMMCSWKYFDSWKDDTVSLFQWMIYPRTRTPITGIKRKGEKFSNFTLGGSIFPQISKCSFKIHLEWLAPIVYMISIFFNNIYTPSKKLICSDVNKWGILIHWRHRLSDVTMDFAQERYTGQVAAVEVEQCSCPIGYKGLSCEDCDVGYTRSVQGVYLGLCEPCECNGHSDQCDPDTGVCLVRSFLPFLLTWIRNITLSDSYLLDVNF